MRRCWSSGGRSNFEFERRPVDCGRERADGNLDGSLHEPVAHHQERQELRQHHAWLRPHDHRVRRANAIHLRHRQLALVGAAAAENDVALAETQLCADDIAALAPPTNVQVSGIEVIQPNVDILRRIRWLDALIDALGELAKRQPSSTLCGSPSGSLAHGDWAAGMFVLAQFASVGRRSERFSSRRRRL